MNKDNAIENNINSHFDSIYVQYYSRMLRFATEYVGSEADAENIVQDIFLYLWERRDSTEIHTNMGSYLFTLVKNKCLDYLRHQTVVEEYNQEYAYKYSALELLNQQFNSEEEFEGIIKRAIDKLPERCKEIFIKNRLEGKKYREIANDMAISENTVENQMSIALKKLRHELRNYLSILLISTIVLLFVC